MKPQVFLSHSCKDAELDDGVALDDETDLRRRRLKFARAVRDAVAAGLAPGIDVLLDRERLDVGDRWRVKLLRWLGSCSGAVVLLSQDSIQSHWVRQEATIATWRKWLRDEFVLVPVLLEDLSTAQLEQAGFGAMQISEFQAARLDSHAGQDSASAAELAARVAQRFAAAAAAQPGELQDWVDNVAATLLRAGVPENILAKTLAPLGIAEADWQHFPDRACTVAHSLLFCGLAAASQALQQIKGAISDADCAALIGKLLPTWVDATAASALAAHRAPPRPWFALNTDDPEVARDYAQRAYCCPGWWANRCVDFDEAVGEGQAAEALQRLTTVVARQQGVRPDMPPAVLQRLLSRNPFFVVFGSQLGSAAQLRPLMAASPTLSGLTCLCLAGAGFEHAAPDWVRLQPALSEPAFSDALADRLEIENLIPR